MEGKLLFWERNHESPNESVLTKPGFVMFRTGALIIFFVGAKPWSLRLRLRTHYLSSHVRTCVGGRVRAKTM